MRFFLGITLVAQILISAAMPARAEDTVSKVQRYLDILGYDADVVDGLYGKKNGTCIRSFLLRARSN